MMHASAYDNKNSRNEININS